MSTLRRDSAGSRADAVKRALAGLAALVAAVIGLAWAALAVDYATGDSGLRGGEDADLQIAQALLAALGVAAAALTAVTGLVYARGGNRPRVRWQLAGIAFMIPTLVGWTVIIFVLSSD